MANKSKPAWVYILAGVLIGLFAAALIYLSTRSPSALSGEGKRQQAREMGQKIANQIDQAQERVKAGTKAELNTQLDFYHQLPKLVIGTPEKTQKANQKPAPKIAPKADLKPEKPAPKAPTAATTTAPQNPSGKNYLLQIGSFTEFARADQRRAELILAGWDVSVKTAALNDGRQVYRVMIGPVAEGDLNATTAKLARDGISKKPLVVRAN